MEDWTYALMGAVAGAAAGVGVGYAVWGRTPAATNHPAGAIRGRSNTSASYALPNKNAKIGFGALATPQRQVTQVSPWLFGSTNAPFNQQSSIVNPEGQTAIEGSSAQSGPRLTPWGLEQSSIGSQVTPVGSMMLSSMPTGRTMLVPQWNAKGNVFVNVAVPSCLNVYLRSDGTKVELEEPCG